LQVTSMPAYHIYIKLTDVCVKITDVCYWYHLLKKLVWVLSIFISSQNIFYMYKRGWSVLTAIYKYFDHSLYVLWFWKIKTLFFTFSRLCVVPLIQIYHRTSSIPVMYKTNMFSISFNSENDHSASFSHLLSIFK
jgi:hypothetical protein